MENVAVFLLEWVVIGVGLRSVRIMEIASHVTTLLTARFGGQVALEENGYTPGAWLLIWTGAPDQTVDQVRRNLGRLAAKFLVTRMADGVSARRVKEYVGLRDMRRVPREPEVAGEQEASPRPAPARPRTPRTVDRLLPLPPGYVGTFTCPESGGPPRVTSIERMGGASPTPSDVTELGDGAAVSGPPSPAWDRA